MKVRPPYDGKDRMVSEDPFWTEVLGKKCYFCHRIINAADVAGAITFCRQDNAPFLYKLFIANPIQVVVDDETASTTSVEPKPLTYKNNGQLYTHSWCLPKKLWLAEHPKVREFELE